MLRRRLRLLRRDLRGRRRSRLGRRRSRRRRRRRLGRGGRGLRGRRRGLRRLVLRDIQTRLIDRNDALRTGLDRVLGPAGPLVRVVVRRNDRDELVRTGGRDRLSGISRVLEVGEALRALPGVPGQLLELVELRGVGVVPEVHRGVEILRTGRQQRLQAEVGELRPLVVPGLVRLDRFLDQVDRRVPADTVDRDRLVLVRVLSEALVEERGSLSQLLRGRVRVRVEPRGRDPVVDAPAVAELIVDADKPGGPGVPRGVLDRLHTVGDDRRDGDAVPRSLLIVCSRRSVRDHDRPHHDDGHSGEQG